VCAYRKRYFDIELVSPLVDLFINGPKEAYGKFGAESVKAEPCMLIADEVGPRGIF
jgi:hypothetical protein